MAGLSMQKAMWSGGLHPGTVPDRGAAKDPSNLLALDHDLDVLPDAGRKMSVAELADHVDDLAGRLSAAGIRSGDHVAIHKAANFDVWILGTAASRIGAIPVMLSPHLDAPTVGALLARLDRPYLLTDGAKLDGLADVAPAGRVLVVDGHRDGATSLAELAGSPRVPSVNRPVDEPALITHTSGTTGLPKLVVHTPRSMGARLRPQWWLLALMRRRETIAIHISFLHSRMFAAMTLALAKGMPVLLVRDADPEHVATLFRAHRPGFLEVLPNALMEWERYADDPRRPFSSIKYFSTTFDAIHPRTISTLLRASGRRLPLFFQIYGQSEVGPAVGRPYFAGSAHRTDGRCVGWPMPGCAQVRVVSRDGKRPSRTNPGFIDVKWSGNFRTYHGEQERFDENRHGQWWRTGDVGYRTRYGCLHMLDREVDMIDGVDSGLEVEDLVLSRMDELSELVLVPGAGSEAIPVVCTTDDRPLDRERWSAAVREFPQLADPVQIDQADIPRTATMKVQRIALARKLNEQLTGRT